ncbi:MAG: 3-methyl-2-oxobutanoate hydroxymethyltransferase [Candidatus Hinthialibacter antarcticus]|nr:3-methyl-2-oxobutanoate hydroxymethyltransferase [Candidatus Hinthialibacter antarcticus]
MMKTKRMTVPDFQRMKRRDEKISVLTAYDYTFSQLMDKAGVDAILVGDSLGMIVQGQDSTIPVTLDDVVYHTRAVKRGVQHAMIIADLPFLTYQISVEEAMKNAARLLQEGGADAVKLEGGRSQAQTVKRLVEAGVPVMGHVGLGPQSIKQLGTHKVHGKTAHSAAQLVEDACALQDAGAFSIVIEAVPWPVAQRITDTLTVPTIGIGAGPHCDGQVLVFADLLGLFTAFQPHFVRRFAQMGDEATQAFKEFDRAVKDGTFPSLDESYPMDEDERAQMDHDPFVSPQGRS